MTHDPFDPYEQWLGIGPDERPIDFYRLLGLEAFETDRERIAAAAEERMRHIRTFQTGPRGVLTQKILNELARAKLRLLDEATKREYDRRLHQSAKAAAEFSQEDDLDLPEPLAVPTAYAQPVPQATAPHPALVTGPVAVRPAGPRIDPRRPVARRRPKVSAYVGLLITFVVTVVVVVCVLYFGRDQIFAPPPPPPNPEEALLPTAEEVLPPSVARQDAAGRILLTPELANIVGTTPKLISEGTVGAIADWTSAEDRLSWKFHTRKKSVFNVTVTYAPFGELHDARLRLELPDQAQEWDLRAPSDGGTKVRDTELMHVAEPGTHELTMRLVHPGQNFALAVYSVELTPFRGPTRPASVDEPTTE